MEGERWRCLFYFVSVVLTLQLSLWALSVASEPTTSQTRQVVLRYEIRFPTSCVGVEQAFNEAVEVLHSFWYEESLVRFEAIARAQPTCAMAYWGIAMSLWHPLWPAPTAAELAKAQAALGTAAAILKANNTIVTQREKDYISAIDDFFFHVSERSYAERVAAYEAKMRKMHLNYEDVDIEATVFYGLAINAKLLTYPLNATQDVLKLRRKAGKLLELVLIDRPDHPGALHYLLHSYDEVSLAANAVDTAFKYSVVAPAVPHAQHMPSHIFLQLGYWDDVMSSNRKSMEAALVHDRVFYKDNLTVNGKTLEPISEEFAHALSFLCFALGQRVQDGSVRSLIEEIIIDKASKKYIVTDETVANAFSSIPIRFAIDRNKWEELETFELQPSHLPWSDYLWAPLFKYYARTMSLIRQGKLAQASQMLKTQLQPAWESWRASNRYAIASEDWKAPLDFLVTSCSLWLEFLNEKEEQARLATIEKMKSLAIAGQDGTDIDRSWISAWDQVAEMYQNMSKHAEAVEAFTTSLSLGPNRFRALAGGAKSAFLAGNKTLGISLFKSVLALCHPEGIDVKGLTNTKADASCGSERMSVYKELYGLWKNATVGSGGIQDDQLHYPALSDDMDTGVVMLLLGGMGISVLLAVSFPLTYYLCSRTKSYYRIAVNNPNDNNEDIL